MKRIIKTEIDLAISFTKKYPIEIEVDTLEFESWLGSSLVPNQSFIDNYILENKIDEKISEILINTSSTVNYSILSFTSDLKDISKFITAVTTVKDCCKLADPSWIYCPTCGKKLK